MIAAGDLTTDVTDNDNDKEYWKYVRLQMLWLFIIGFFCSTYEILMGLLGVIIIDNMNLADWFGLKCISGVLDKAVWEEPSKAPGEIFSVLHHVIIIMYATL